MEIRLQNLVVLMQKDIVTYIYKTNQERGRVRSCINPCSHTFTVCPLCDWSNIQFFSMYSEEDETIIWFHAVKHYLPA